MLTNVFWRSIGERLPGIAGFGVAAVAVSAMYIGVFPAFQDQMVGYADAMPEGMAAFMGNDFASPAGYLHSTIFTILGPVLLVAAGVTWAAAAIAGEEQNRTLGLLLSTPLPRLRLALQKLAAVVVALTAVAAVLLAAVLGMVSVAGLDLAPSRALAAVVHLHGLAVLAASVSLGAGAATGRRALAIGLGAGVVVAGFVVSGVSQMVDGLMWLRWISPFYWFNGSEPIRNGIAWGPLLLLYAAAVVVAAAGIWRFDRRDLS